MSFKRAIKEQSKLRLALGGLPGAGKTYTAVRVGHEIGQLIRTAGLGEGRMAVIDSERGSASLYADKFPFDVCELETYSPLLYVEKIKEAEAAGYDIIIVDSLSHAWAGKDGALEQKDRAAESKGNSYTAWGVVTPKQNALIDAMLGSRAHVIATMRQKQDFVQEYNEKTKKTEIKKVGLALVQRDQIEFEFTLVGEIDHSHTLKITKTRLDGVIDIGDLFEKPGESFAKKVFGWMSSGVPATERVRPATVEAKSAPTPAEKPAPAQKPEPVAAAVDEAFAAYLSAMQLTTSLAELDRVAGGPSKPAKGSANHKRATEVYLKQKATIEARQTADSANEQQPTEAAS